MTKSFFGHSAYPTQKSQVGVTPRSPWCDSLIPVEIYVCKASQLEKQIIPLFLQQSVTFIYLNATVSGCVIRYVDVGKDATSDN